MHSSKINAAEVFVALDLDRTLLQTDSFAQLVFEVASGKLSNTVLREIRRNEQVQRGQMYDALEALVGAGCPAEYIEKSILERESTQLLYEGVGEVLQWLDRSVGGWGIITYGSLDGQRLKLRLAEAELKRTLPALVTDSRSKPQLVASWQLKGDGAFTPPAVINPGRREYSTVVIVDDKMENIPKLKPGQYGILVDNTHHNSAAASIPAQLQHLLSVSG